MQENLQMTFLTLCWFWTTFVFISTLITNLNFLSHRDKSAELMVALKEGSFYIFRYAGLTLVASNQNIPDQAASEISWFSVKVNEELKSVAKFREIRCVITPFIFCKNVICNFCCKILFRKSCTVSLKLEFWNFIFLNEIFGKRWVF